MVSRVVFSSKWDSWPTPDALYESLDAEFGFVFDLAASSINNRHANYYSAEDDSLAQDWTAIRGAKFLNPPYGRKIGAWVKKASESGGVVCLLPSRTDVRWWHDYVWDAHLNQPRPGVEVRFIKGRVKFKGASAGAPFPSVVVVFR